MDRLSITGADRETSQFVEQWLDDRDYIVAHTSGSTGTPKEIRLLKADMAVSARATCRFFGIGADSHLVMPLSASYIAGKMMIVRAWESGARLTVLPPSRSLAGLCEVSGDIDLLPIVPSQLDGLLQATNLDRIRNVIIGGAPLTAEQEAAVLASGMTAYATYGMTETCSHVALRRIGHDDAFSAMPGVEFAADGDGCLIIEAPEYSAVRFVTNDVVEVIDSRHFRWLGRRDNVINSGGIKIIPEQVEGQLRPWLDGVDYYLTSRQSDVWGEEMVMVVATHGRDVDVTAALERARAVLPHHLLPKAVIYVREHEFTASGKVRRGKM